MCPRKLHGGEMPDKKILKEANNAPLVDTDGKGGHLRRTLIYGFGRDMNRFGIFAGRRREWG